MGLSDHASPEAASDDRMRSAVTFAVKRDTPAVVLVVFNRPQAVAQVLDRLAALRPSRLFVVGDGPRASQPADPDRVAAVRALIDRVPWPCEVLTDYAPENLGCRRRVATGLNWVFSHVEEAIILEDDCLPTSSFMRYASELLERYRTDTRIGSVCGSLSVPRIPEITADYFFSRYNLFTGWATWRRAWQLYDDAMTPLEDGTLGHVLSATFENARARWYWNWILRRTQSGLIDSWGYRWMLSCWCNSMLGIFPRHTLIDNVGFGGDATNTRRKAWYFQQDVGDLGFPLRHPHGVSRRADIDRLVEDARYSKSVGGRLRWAWDIVRDVYG